MTVPVQTPFNSSTGNGVTTVFPYTFLILDEEDIKVTVDGVLKTIATDYTVSGVGNPGGGSVTFLAAPANGTTVVRYSDTMLKRETDYQTNGDFREVVVDADFDRAWLALRDVSYKGGRALRVPAGETAVTLPASADRANRFLTFNASGDPVAAAGATDVPVSVFMESVLTAANAPAARALLGFESSSGGDFLVFQNTAPAAEAALRLNTTQATSGISLKLSNSSLNVQAALRGRGDGGLTAYVGQTAGAASTGGVQAFDINPDGTIIVGNTPKVNDGRILLIVNGDPGANTYARVQVTSDAGDAFFQVQSVAGGRAVTLYSATGSAFNIFTQDAQQLRLGTNNNANRIVIGSTGGITVNEDMTFSASRNPVAKNTAKAWVNFDGTVSAASMIRDSYNVASITDNGEADYTINFATALPSANYCAVGTAGFTSGSGFITFRGPTGTTPTTTAYRCRVSDSVPNFADTNHICIAFFG